MSEERVWTGAIHREYGLMRLSRKDLNTDPILQFGNWFEDGKPTVLEPNAMALATADPAARPSLRMVLMKAFDHRGIVFATSYLSRKGREVEANPAAALLFYWPQLERQVRIAGDLEKTSAGESDEIFQGRHPKSRIAAIISRQSEPVANREELEARYFAEEKKWNDTYIARPETWGGYRLKPIEFEFWQGGEHRLHDRFAYRRKGETWQIQRLGP